MLRKQYKEYYKDWSTYGHLYGFKNVNHYVFLQYIYMAKTDMAYD